MMLGKNIIPVDRVEVPALGPLGMCTPSLHLKIFDLGCGMLTNAWLISIGAANHILFSFLLRPWVWQAASKTLALDKATCNRLTTLGGVISSSILLKSLFGNTWEGQSSPPWGWNHVELLAPASNTNIFEDVADTIL